MRIASRSSAPPASRRRTETDGSDESRLVSAQPAEPAPTTTKSYLSAAIGFSRRLRREVPDLTQLERIDDPVVTIMHQGTRQLAPAPVDIRVPEPSPRLGVVDARVKENHIVELEERDLGDALPGDLLLQLRPDVVVPVHVIVQLPRLELEDERLPDRFGHRVTPSHTTRRGAIVAIGGPDRTGWALGRLERCRPKPISGGMR